MKKARLLSLVLASVFLFGCAGNETIGTISIDKSSFPNELNIAVMGAFANSEDIVDEEALAEWEVYMSDLYGTDINLHSSPYSGYGMWIIAEDILYTGERTGFAEMNSNFILQMIKADKIEPLDAYLAKNKVWKSLPEEYKKRFELDGHIWAIPKSMEKIINLTSVRTDWLKTVGKKMPTTTQELADIGKALLKADPDGDGIETNNYLLGDYSAVYPDILASYGLYIDYNNQIGIAYDPNEDAFVDAMFKPEAKEALQYLKNLMQAGVIDPLSINAPNESATKASSGSYGALIGGVSDGKYYSGVTWARNNAPTVLGRELDLTKEEDYTYATNLYEALPPLTSDNPVTYMENTAGYVLIKNTEDPKASVNAFVDILFGSKQSFLSCYMGQPEHYTCKNDNAYVMNLNGEIPYLNPNLVTATSVLFDDDVTFFRNGNYSEGSVQLQKDSAEYEKKYFERYTKTGQLFKVPVFYTMVSDTYAAFDWSIYVAFQKLMLTLMDNNTTVEEALERYQTEMQIYQVDTILEEANTNIGKPVSK